MRISELEGRRTGVWGAGREGLAAVAAVASVDPGAKVVVHTDTPPSAGEQMPANVVRVHGEGGLAELGRCEVVIRSPGVSRYRPEVGLLAESGVKLTTGTNLWFAEFAARGRGEIVAVTGTKGKSTTSALIARLVGNREPGVRLAGNIGKPLLDTLDALDTTPVWVLELSSYQAADLDEDAAALISVAVLTNLYSEHLNWHGSTDVYRRDKLRMMAGAPIVVANRLDRLQLEHFAGDPRVRWYGEESGWHVTAAGVARGGHGEVAEVDMSGLPAGLLDAHMRLNLCAALTAEESLQGRGDTGPGVAAVLAGFKPLPHRVQDLGVVEGAGGVEWRFVNDSIATAPQAVVAAIDAIQERHPGHPVALLAGGFDREQGYGEIVERVSGDPGVAAVIGLPATGTRVVAEVAAAPEPPAVLEAAENMESAIAAAKAALPAGGVILLSPGAPSFGTYADFEHRGHHFAECAGLDPDFDTARAGGES